MNEQLIKKFIARLSLSGIPPVFQEYLLSNIAEFTDEELNEMIVILNNLAKVEQGYLKASGEYESFLKRLGDLIAKKQTEEVKLIQQELEAEITQVLVARG